MRTGTFILGVLVTLALVACGGGEHDDLRQWMKESTKDLKGKVPPLPEIKAFPIVSYETADLVAPFQSSRIEPEKKAGGGGIKPDLNRPREPLESFPLESLTMVGTLQQGKMAYAIIRADKSVYRVKIGNYLGQNFGIITNVIETEVQLRELVQDAAGDWIERSSTLQLQEQEGNK